MKEIAMNLRLQRDFARTLAMVCVACSAFEFDGSYGFASDAGSLRNVCNTEEPISIDYSFDRIAPHFRTAGLVRFLEETDEDSSTIEGETVELNDQRMVFVQAGAAPAAGAPAANQSTGTQGAGVPAPTPSGATTPTSPGTANSVNPSATAPAIPGVANSANPGNLGSGGLDPTTRNTNPAMSDASQPNVNAPTANGTAPELGSPSAVLGPGTDPNATSSTDSVGSPGQIRLGNSNDSAPPAVVLGPLRIPNTTTTGIGTGALPRNAIEGQLPSPRHLPTGTTRDNVFALSSKQWVPGGFFHQPLYWENPMLERHGHQVYPALQPAISGFRFYGTVLVLPYLATLRDPLSEVHTLGDYRPGSPAPALRYRPYYDTRAIRNQLIISAAATALSAP